MLRRDGMLVTGMVGLFVLVGLTSSCQQPPTTEPSEASPAASAPPAPPPETAPATTPSAAPGPAGQEEVEAQPSLKFVDPVRGTADVGHLAPKTKVEGNVVVTTIQVKNLSNKAIAGLKVDEFWWDRENNPVTGDTARLRQPLMPGETAELTLRTPKHPRMHRNSYQFSHAYGRVKTTLLRSLE